MRLGRADEIAVVGSQTWESFGPTAFTTPPSHVLASPLGFRLSLQLWLASYMPSLESILALRPKKVRS
jgi:hypothetical protein